MFESGGVKVGGGGGNDESCDGNGGRVGGRSYRESKSVCGEVGGVEKISSTGSKLMDRGEECLEAGDGVTNTTRHRYNEDQDGVTGSHDGIIGAGGGEVSGGGDDFGVSKSSLGEILGVVIGKSGEETFGDGGGTVWHLLNLDLSDHHLLVIGLRGGSSGLGCGWRHLNVGDGSRRDETILHMLCILNGLLYIVMEGLEIVDFLLNTFSFEKVKALGAKGVVKGSKLGVVWMMLCGGIKSARVVSRVVVMIALLML
ncbi:hypothetical protein Tco_1429904 [Tanacetum coccineum]